MDKSIQSAGANARAAGCTEFDNPYYKAENMPAATGERAEEWAEKEIAWRLGWIAEDAIRRD